MNATNQKIWQFSLNNKDILKHLFNYDCDSQDINEYMITEKYYAQMEDYEIEMIESTDWLCRFNILNRVILGVDKEDDTARCITNTGEVGDFCETFSSVPYEILRRDMPRNSNTQNYFNRFPEFYQALQKYDTWAKENNIELDQYHIYHNNNGELFKEYFEL